MNIYKRVLSLVCVVLVLLVPFSTVVNASYDNTQLQDNIKVTYINQCFVNSQKYVNVEFVKYYGIAEFQTGTIDSKCFSSIDEKSNMQYVFGFSSVANSHYGSDVIISKGDSFSVSGIFSSKIEMIKTLDASLLTSFYISSTLLSNGVVTLQFYDSIGSYVKSYSPTSYSLTKSTKGSEYIDLNVSMSDVPYDVYGFKVIVTFPLTVCYPNMFLNTYLSKLQSGTHYVNAIAGSYSPHPITLNIDDKDTGLLQGIIEWLKSIKNGLTDGFSNVVSNLSNGFNNMLSKLSDLWDSITNGFANVIQYIIELPQKIWIFIREGLKELFVPDDEFMDNYANDWTDTLSSRFGAVFQSVEYLTDFFSAFSPTDDKQDIIDFPEFSINIIDDVEFSLGPYEVDCVPNGFETLATTCKAFTGVVMTLVFIQGIPKRYEEVMGVNT